MTVYTIRILNTNTFYGDIRNLYCYRYKSQAYKVATNWFAKETISNKKIIEIKKYNICELPTTRNIVIPADENQYKMRGTFVDGGDGQNTLEKIWTL